MDSDDDHQGGYTKEDLSFMAEACDFWASDYEGAAPQAEVDNARRLAEKLRYSVRVWGP